MRERRAWDRCCRRVLAIYRECPVLENLLLRSLLVMYGFFGSEFLGELDTGYVSCHRNPVCCYHLRELSTPNFSCFKRSWIQHENITESEVLPYRARSLPQFVLPIPGLDMHGTN